MVGASRHKWSFGESTKFPKAPPLQLSGQESDACVCVRVCSRVRVWRLRVPTFPRFEQARTPRQGDREEEAATSGEVWPPSNPGRRTAGDTARRGNAGLPSLGAKRAAVPSARRGPAAGRAPRSRERRLEGAVCPCGRQAPGADMVWERVRSQFGSLQCVSEPAKDFEEDCYLAS